MRCFPCQADHWLVIKKYIGQKTHLIIHVDDGELLCKDKSEGKEDVKTLSTYIVVQDIEETVTFVEFKILANRAKDIIFIYKPNLIKAFEGRNCIIGRISKGKSNTSTTKIYGKMSR
jgi:hypothetical protein